MSGINCGWGLSVVFLVVWPRRVRNTKAGSLCWSALHLLDGFGKRLCILMAEFIPSRMVLLHIRDY